jgi:hypothetical protein
MPISFIKSSKLSVMPGAFIGSLPLASEMVLPFDCVTIKNAEQYGFSRANWVLDCHFMRLGLLSLSLAGISLDHISCSTPSRWLK